MKETLFVHVAWYLRSSMDLTMNRHEILSSLASIIMVLFLIAGFVLIVAAFFDGNLWLAAYGVATGFTGIVYSALLEWMRSVYVALYNINRLLSQPETQSAETQD